MSAGSSEMRLHQRSFSWKALFPMSASCPLLGGEADSLDMLSLRFSESDPLSDIATRGNEFFAAAYSGLMLAALMIGHHFSISALTRDLSHSGDWSDGG